MNAAKEKESLRERLLEYLFVTARCYDEHFPECPSDGPSYLGHGYFRPVAFEQVQSYWRTATDLIRAGRAPAQLGLYVHWPFCISPCAFCFATMRVPKGPGELGRYGKMLLAEAHALRGLFAGLRFSSFNMGGGTPSYMPEADLDALLGALRAAFEWAPGLGFSFESSPSTLTRGKVEVLARHGVTHLILGVQSLDAKVLARAHRAGQTLERVERAVTWARAAGLRLGVDLLYGIDGQTDASFLADVRTVLGLGPNDLRVQFFEPRVCTPFARSGLRVPSRHWERALVMGARLDETAAACGYGYSATDPHDPEFIQPLVPQTREALATGASILGLGAGALSHAFGAAWYEHPPELDPRRWGPGPLPVRAFEVGMEEERRGYALRLLRFLGRFSRAEFRGMFGCDPLEDPGLAQALRELEGWGKIRITGGTVALAGTDMSRMRDRMDGLVYTKHLHPPALVRAVIGAHRAEFEDFRSQQARAGVGWTRFIRQKFPGTAWRFFTAGPGAAA